MAKSPLVILLDENISGVINFLGVTVLQPFRRFVLANMVAPKPIYVKLYKIYKIKIIEQASNYMQACKI
jgi:hypothetical protein